MFTTTYHLQRSKDFLGLENELSEMLAELATDMRGSFVREHGIEDQRLD